MTIRRATEADLEAIHAIYDEEVRHGTATFDTTTRSPEERVAWLAHHDPVRHPVLVEEHDGVVRGWASLSRWSERCAYDRMAEVSLYVHADHRGKGIGRALLRALIDHGRASGLKVLLARIVTDNPASVRLHENAGFRRCGLLRRSGEKLGRVLDVALLDLHLDEVVASPAVAKLELFWDVVSPYSYLATSQLEGVRARTGATIVLRPFLLGAVMKATANNPPALVTAKVPYLLKDLLRWRDAYGIPMKMPGEGGPFPFNSLFAMRTATAAAMASDHAGESACHALFAAYWRDGRDVMQPDVVAAALTSAGLDGAALVAAASTDAVKDALRAHTDEAIRRGAFGAPTMFVGDEMFFGNDRLPFVELALLAASGR
ncbi:MAG: GNAT family N-acetyltransferase [Deltaproteobacteria bacterium]|nr:GNAT family N-acetyltransferase [Deltaproteobacteria bacterium]